MPHDSRDESRRRHRDHDPDHRRRHRKHRPTDSAGELLPKHDRQSSRNSASYDVSYSYDTPETASGSPSPRKIYSSHRHGGSSTGGGTLSTNGLAQLNKLNQKRGFSGEHYDEQYLEEVRERERRLEKERRREERRSRRAERDAQKAEVERAEAAAQEARDEERKREAERRANLDRDKWRRKQEEVDSRERYEEYEYGSQEEDRVRVYRDEKHRKRRYTESEKEEKRRRRRDDSSRRDKRDGKKARVASGQVLEKGDKSDYEYRTRHRGGAAPSDYSYDEPWWKRRKKWIIGGLVFIIILIIAIVVAVVVSKNKSDPVESQAASDTAKPKNSNLDGLNEDSYPKGTYFDPFTWYDTEDFNLTYTGQLVGGLPVMGLNTSYNDNVQCNPNVPALKDTFEYGKMPVRGINIGGWLSIEPFITPSFFKSYSTHDNVIDEWTLTTALGSSRAAQTLEQHYSAFVNFQTFVDIRNAGFDHVRIPFSYWAVTTYEGDPYVAKISWRYLLRAIEWARQNGLRVNLDLHGIPGSQNGWNHSGRQGVVGWLNGTDGALNAQRSLDIHDQLSTFFAQPRYKHLVTMYGLVNEPRMTELDVNDVLNWTTTAISTIRGNGIDGVIVFGDGFMGLDKWQGKLTNEPNLLLDVHQYVIFNTDQLVLNHSEKLNFACGGWTAQMKRSMNTATGFGPTMCGEWSQADTDCATYLNNVGIGSRWQGTLNTGNASTSILTPTCPTNNNPQCECNDANADPSDYSDAYKKWLLDFAEAQMDSFEQGWGWFYWTWDTEQSPQWSYKKGMEAGILPSKVYERSFKCTQDIPDFKGMGLAENY